MSADARYVVHVGFEPGAKQSLWLRQVATNSNVQIVPPDTVRYDGISFSPDANFIYYAVYPAGPELFGRLSGARARRDAAEDHRRCRHATGVLA